jgi:WD40 repeat protein
MVLGLIALLLALLLRPEPVMHTGYVNSVAFSGNGFSVISASDDCTLRFWSINRNNNSIEPEKFSYQEQQQPIACKKPQKAKGLLAVTNHAVSVSDLRPVDNNIVAVGLDNGVIELRNVGYKGETREELQDKQDPKAIGDRVFDLEFTKDPRYLFSGHGSGKVRLWSRTSPNSEFKKQPQIIDIQNQLKLSKFQARALTLSPDDQTLVIGGNFKRFLFGAFNPKQLDNQLRNLSMQKLEVRGSTGHTDYIWAMDFVPQPQGKKQILATADSAGYITIWNLDQCQTVTNASPQNPITEVNCQQLDNWQASKMPVRTLKFSEDGRLLVSGGDDGKVIVWYLTPAYQLDKTKAATGQTIYQSSKRINSVDLKDNMIVSGGEDFQVKLHRVR